MICYVMLCFAMPYHIKPRHACRQANMAGILYSVVVVKRQESSDQPPLNFYTFFAVIGSNDGGKSAQEQLTDK